MQYLTDQGEAKAIDKYTIKEMGIPSLVLQERAALAVAWEAQKHVKAGELVLAVCGTGNNGADGIGAARILYTRGYRVQIAIAGNREHATEEWMLQYEIAKRMGLSIRNQYPDGEYTDRERPALLLDALLGVGLSREVEGNLALSIRQMEKEGCPILAVDIASGIHSTTGKILGIGVRADWTVTFGCKKLGQVLYPGALYSGEVVVKDIGFPPESMEEVSPKAFTWERGDLSRLPKRPAHSHKGSFGKVLVIAGQKNMAGAAFFSAMAAYRTGAGLVQVMTVEENRVILQQRLPESILTTYQEENFTIEAMKEPCQWADVIVIGPGIGQGSHVRSMLNYIFQYTKAPVVLDADALNVISKNPSLMDLAQGRAVITPHVGEMARLCGVSAGEVASRIPETAKSYSFSHKVVCVLKDSRTVVARPEGEMYVNLTGNSGMATGGSGDVLSGVIGGLLAGGMNLFGAASMGVYIHGLAGDLAAERLGEHSVMAGDILDALPSIMKEAERGI